MYAFAVERFRGAQGSVFILTVACSHQTHRFCLHMATNMSAMRFAALEAADRLAKLLAILVYSIVARLIASIAPTASAHRPATAWSTAPCRRIDNPSPDFRVAVPSPSQARRRRRYVHPECDSSCASLPVHSHRPGTKRFSIRFAGPTRPADRDCAIEDDGFFAAELVLVARCRRRGIDVIQRVASALFRDAPAPCGIRPR